MAKRKPGVREEAAVRHPGKARPGKDSKRGVSFNPSKLKAAAMPALQPKQPRPARTRFPISLREYAALKAAALTRKVKVPAKAVVADKGKKRPVLATAALAAPPAAAPVALGNFAGISATGSVPPDCAMAAGPNHVLVAVNSTAAVYTKSGVKKFQRTLTQWFSNVMTNVFIFDPKVLYDQFAARWVLLAMALPLAPSQTGSWFLLSISKSSDPLGAWWNYAINASLDGGTWADFPGLGVDALNLYLTANMFEFDGDFAYAYIRVVNKLLPYNGGQPVWVDYPNLKNADGSLAFTVQPCHTYGNPGVQYFVNSYYPTLTNVFPKKLSSTWSSGTSARAWASWPGWPPGRRPDGARGAGRRTAGGSVDDLERFLQRPRSGRPHTPTSTLLPLGGPNILCSR